MLCPSDGITDRPSFFRPRCRRERLRSFEENVFWNTAVAFNHLRRIAREVPLQHLKHASRIFERRIPFELVCLLGLASTVLSVPTASRRVARLRPAFSTLHRRAAIEPALRVVLLLLRIPPGKHSVQIFCVLEVVAQQGWRVRVVN